MLGYPYSRSDGIALEEQYNDMVVDYGIDDGRSHQQHGGGNHDRRRDSGGSTSTSSNNFQRVRNPYVLKRK